MSLTDFWDNITTPGFLAASFDELKEMLTDFKAEVSIPKEFGSTGTDINVRCWVKQMVMLVAVDG